MDREEDKKLTGQEAGRVAAQKRRKRSGMQSGAARKTGTAGHTGSARQKRPGQQESRQSSSLRAENPQGGKKRSRTARSAKARSAKARKRAGFDVVSTVVLIVAVCVFVFSLYQLVMMLVPYYTGSQEYDSIKEYAITEGNDGQGFKVDFDALLEENEDTVAWIRFDEPSIISYPVVKSADNNEYLTKSFSAKDNKLGTIFVDMRNSSDFTDRNTLVYGHNLRVSGRMFSKLLEYENQSFYEENPYFYIYTPDGEVKTYTIFAVSVVQDTAENYNITYATDADFEEYLQLCKSTSLYDTGVEVNAQSRIVSLSTCTNGAETERFLVQGVLTAED